MAVAVCWPIGPRAAQAAEPPAGQLVAVKGALPLSGRVVIRSGLAWMDEDDPLFTAVARSLGAALIRRGLAVVTAEPSREAPLPKGTEAVRNAPVPKHMGAPRRIMSVAEAVSRMKAMQLAREGRLPQATFQGADPGNGARGPNLTHQELIRFALSQEEGEPELRGQVTVPGRLPDEVRASDPARADYALTVRFAMLWPGPGIPDEQRTRNSNSGLAVGWHLLELSCYDLAPAREGKEPRLVWDAVVQRVTFGMYLRGTLPAMARDAVEKRE
ncbi:MAG: hypothetical protein LIP28_00405 [Deltaproteobacteria bacterium]|nr:hypothetical protein [Deltaproteobacteria bacterium]